MLVSAVCFKSLTTFEMAEVGNFCVSRHLLVIGPGLLQIQPWSPSSALAALNEHLRPMRPSCSNLPFAGRSAVFSVRRPERPALLLDPRPAVLAGTCQSCLGASNLPCIAQYSIAPFQFTCAHTIRCAAPLGPTFCMYKSQPTRCQDCRRTLTCAFTYPSRQGLTHSSMH